MRMTCPSFRVAHADARGDRQPLRVLVGADRGVDQLIGDEVGQVLAMVVGDDLEHQVDRRRAARGGDPVAVDHEDRLRQGHVLEFLGETVLVLPVDRRALAVQQPRLGQRVARRAEPAHHRALARLAPAASR
jgi:hypothetical protein